jgi:FkbM family methyltransferase
MIKCIKRLFYKTKKIGQIPKEIIARYLPENPVILEAGAHVGTDTIEMLKVWPNAKIYAFEPVPVLFSALVNNTRVSHNILCFQLALSDNVGKSSLFVSSGSSDGSSSLLTPKEHLSIHPSVKFEEQLIIETTTIDEWASKNNLHGVDFLWLDLQGMELKVLKASPNILRSVQAIYMEVSFIEN